MRESPMPQAIKGLAYSHKSCQSIGCGMEPRVFWGNEVARGARPSRVIATVGQP